MSITELRGVTGVYRSRRLLQYALALFFTLSAVFATWADNSCIVSGNTTRDAAASETSVLGVGNWFDSSSFCIVMTPTLRNFNSRPVGMIISFY